MKVKNFQICILVVFPALMFAQKENDHQSKSTLGLNFECQDDVKCNLIIFNGLFDWLTLTSHSGGQEVSSEDEETKGAVTVANKNDTDGDEIIDNTPTETSVVASSIGRNEIDLMKLVLKKPVPNNGGNVTLTIVQVASGIPIQNIKLWNNPTKGTEITVNSNGQVILPVSSLDKTIYIEALGPSLQPRDIKLKMEYNGHYDIVQATAVWAQRTNVWRVRSTNNGIPDNPTVGGNSNLPNLDDTNLSTIISLRQSIDGSRYGHGLNERILSENDDKRIGGRILFEYQIFPNDITGLGVTFDITRQRKIFAYRTISGGTLTNSPYVAELFPWEGTPAKDNEFPNDDNDNFDEDTEPNNSLIYSWDAPSELRENSQFYSFLIKRLAFKEFVRIQLGNNIFEHDDSVVVPQGSRASDKDNWHCVYYTRLNSNGKLVQDDILNPVSASAALKSGTGNGTAIITLDQGSANTQGYHLEYDNFVKKWQLKDNGGVSAMSGTINANSWTVTLNGVTATIAQGSLPFTHQDKFTFSVFRTQALSGKLNETVADPLGVAFDVTGNP